MKKPDGVGSLRWLLWRILIGDKAVELDHKFGEDMGDWMDKVNERLDAIDWRQKVTKKRRKKT